MPETSISNDIVNLPEEVNKNEEETKTTSPEIPAPATPAKTENNNGQQESPNYDLNKFRLQRILNNNTRNKSIALLGNFPDLSDSDKAIVIFEKKAFQESEVATKNSCANNEENGTKIEAKEGEQVEEKGDLEKPSYFCNDLKVQTEFINNIYGSYQCTPPAKLSGKLGEFYFLHEICS